MRTSRTTAPVGGKQAAGHQGRGYCQRPTRWWTCSLTPRAAGSRTGHLAGRNAADFGYGTAEYLRNAHIALDQAEYQKRYDSLTHRFRYSQGRLGRQSWPRSQQMQLQRADIGAFLQSFKELPDTLTEFSAENWHALVDYATVYSTRTIFVSPSKTWTGNKGITTDAETLHHWI